MRNRIAQLKTADKQALWKLLGPALYSSKPLLPISMREALQNSVDAQKARGVEAPVEFELRRVPGDSWQLICRDNGVGMDEDTILDKFLSIGDSGKNGENGSTGGFGVAKASLIGACDHWQLRTRDNFLDDTMLGGEPVREAEHFDGCELTLFYSEKEEVSGIKPTSSAVSDGIQYLVSSKAPVKITLRMEDKTVVINHTGLNPDEKLCIGSLSVGRTTIRLYQVPMISYNFLAMDGYASGATYDKELTSKLIYRLNGLTQTIISAPSYEAKFNVVVEIDTLAKPGDADYPFSVSREQVVWEIRNAVSEHVESLFINHLTSLGELAERMGEKKTIMKRLAGSERLSRSLERRMAAKAERDAERAEKAAQKEAQVTAQVEADAAELATKLQITISSLKDDATLVDNSYMERSPTGIKLILKYLSGQKPLDVTRGSVVKMTQVWAEIIDILMDCNESYAHSYGVGIITDPQFEAQRHAADTVYYLFNPKKWKISDPINTVMLMISSAAHELTHAKWRNHNEEFTTAYHAIYTNFFVRRGMNTVYALARMLRGGKETTEETTEEAV